MKHRINWIVLNYETQMILALQVFNDLTHSSQPDLTNRPSEMNFAIIK